jgi:hypothetical protein
MADHEIAPVSRSKLEACMRTDGLELPWTHWLDWKAIYPEVPDGV